MSIYLEILVFYYLAKIVSKITFHRTQKPNSQTQFPPDQVLCSAGQSLDCYQNRRGQGTPRTGRGNKFCNLRLSLFCVVAYHVLSGYPFGFMNRRL